MSNSKKAQMLRDRGNSPLSVLDHTNYLYGTGDKALVQHEDGSFNIGNARLTKTGINIEGSISQPEFDNLAGFLFAADDALQWWLGDLVALSDDLKYGDVTKLAEQFGRNPETITNYGSVCRAIEMPRRRGILTFSHHAAVAGLETTKEQDKWLDRAVQGDGGKPWSVAELRRAISPPTKTLDAIIKTYEQLEPKRRKQFISKQKRLASQKLNRAEQLAKEADDIFDWINRVDK